MALSERRNQNLMQVIKRMHGLMESPDIEKQRHSQEQLASLRNNLNDVLIKDVMLGEMHGEYISVNRAHMKKYVILYCHGGGYSHGKLPVRQKHYGETVQFHFHGCVCL